MRILSRLITISAVAAKRLLAQPGLALSTLLGLAAALSLTISIPLYTNAVYNRVLREELARRRDSFSAWRAPFSLMFSFLGSMVDTKEWEDIQAADVYLRQAASHDLGLPLKLLARSFHTDNFQLFGESEPVYGQNPLAWVSFACLSDLEQHITLVEGSFPQPASPAVPRQAQDAEGVEDSSPIEVLMSEAFANRLGVQGGETYFAYLQRVVEDQDGKNTTQQIEFPVRIIGIWKPTSLQDAYWFTNPSTFDKALFVPEETFSGRLSGSMKGEIYTANWYLMLDGSEVNADGALPLLNRIRMVKNTVSRLLPQAILMTSPEEALQKYQGLTGQLTFTLYAYTLPILTLLLAFISLVVGLAVGQQHNEIAILRSRGGTLIQVTLIAGLQALMLGIVALLISLPLSIVVAQLIGQTRSFLDFGAVTDLRINLSQTALQTGLLLVGLTVFAQVIPTVGAAQYTIVTYKREQARLLRPPWWQRAWLDVILLIPAAYGFYLLRQQGSLQLPIANVKLSHDPFQNPLLLLAPTLCIFALTLFMIRILPFFMKIIAWLSSYTRSIGFLIAARHLARTPGAYTAPLILLVLTLSLSAFTASLAKTLDRHLFDQVYYQVGADATLQDLGEQLGGSPSGTLSTAASGARWFFLPVTEYLKLPEVKDAARLGIYTVNVSMGMGAEQVTLYGVDRVDFRRVAYWRRDFASLSLGTLLNRLAVDPAGVLVCRDLMQKYGLSVGDTLQVKMYADETRREMNLTVVGDFDLFPTWYPSVESGSSAGAGASESGASENGKFLLVGNLENIFEQAGSQLPYFVWLKTTPYLERAEFEARAADIGLTFLGFQEARAQIGKEQQRPERQGLFGILSVGFMASALLTVLGFFLYALFSFRSRFIEMGMLCALGLSVNQMILSMAWELASLLALGLAAGTGLGVGVSQLFIPYLQIGEDAAAQIPPYQVIIAWPEIYRIYALFGLLFLAALIVLGVLLARMKIFQAVKLGETI